MNPKTILPKVAAKSMLTQINKSMSQQKNLTNTVNNTTTCTTRSGLTDCCFKPEWFFSCPPDKNQSVCVGNASDGAWVGYPVSYDILYAECQNIKETLANGQYSEFSASFDANMFR
jgi:hypothetical protein